MSGPGSCHKPGRDRGGKSALAELLGEGANREAHTECQGERARAREERESESEWTGEEERVSVDKRAVYRRRAESLHVCILPSSFTHARLFQEILCYLLRKHGLLSGQCIEREI